MSVNMSAGRPAGHDSDDVVVRKGEHGWVVGQENVSDLTSAMVLADLLAAEQAVNDAAELEAVDGSRSQTRDNLSQARPPAARPPASPPGGVRVPEDMRPRGVRHNENSETTEAARLAVTVAQLEHALASRVRVEQAIGVIAERHRMRPREAFDLLRRAARSRGSRVTELARDVVASAANPLLRLPDELSRKLPEARQRGRSVRRPRHARS
jgi:hypothetical protein